jgi:flagellar basal body rod protein FlgG
MNVSLYQAAAAMNANSRWQDVIADNLASSSVPGFRKQEISIAAVQAGLMPASGLDATGAPHFFTIPKATTTTSFQAGELKFTGDRGDVALEGPGFFEVRLPDGNLAQTRDGEFHVNAQGQLVTKTGYTVMGDSGPIQLDPNNKTPVTISSTGEISQGADLKGKLKITNFDKPALLTQISGGYFLANNPGLRGTPATATVRQGYLESANTSEVREMSNMITAMRTFEANQRIVQIQDERMGKVISDLGNPS